MIEDQGKLLNDFIEYEKARGFKSIKKVKYLINEYFEYINSNDMDILHINHREAQNYQTYLTTLTNPDGSIHYATTTITDMISVTRNLYNYLKVRKYIYSNPFSTIRLLKKENRLPRNIPKEEELFKFMNVLKEFWKYKNLRDQKHFYKMHVIGELMYSCGLRIDEVANLKAGDIDFDRSIVIVRKGKGGKERIGYLNEYAGIVLKMFVTEMKELINVNCKSDMIFGVNDSHILDSRFNSSLKKIGEETGIGRFTSHNFRHCLGFHLLRRGCDMRYIQIILGHDDLKSTTIYTKVDRQDLKNELDKYHPRRFMKDRNQ
jgi:integrase/recombinase XerD